jgi:aryl-alcohol dehydrogenase-like predicted oxidoreductase
MAKSWFNIATINRCAKEFVTMRTRRLGRQGLSVSEMGLGCMGMSWAYGPADEVESLRVLHRSLELGMNFWDTAEIYGPFTNEALLGRALKGRPRDSVTIATKFAWRFGPNGENLGLDSSPTHIRRSIEASLRRLGTDYVDLYYQHRLDPRTRIEETVECLAGLVRAGKVRFIGLSEVGPGTIRRAHAVHPLSAVQMEYSLWERSIENKVLPVMRELGIGLVAYSPIGRGLLSGRIRNVDDLAGTDWRRNNPRFQQANFVHNSKLVEVVRNIAVREGATPAQIALAWVLKRGEDIVPIPGTKHLSYLNENAASVDLELAPAVWSELEKAITSFQVAGLQYHETAMKDLDRTE